MNFCEETRQILWLILHLLAGGGIAGVNHAAHLGGAAAGAGVGVGVGLGVSVCV
jgi:hypothetical protein